MYPALDRKFQALVDAVMSEDFASDIWESEKYCKFMNSLSRESASLMGASGLDYNAVSVAQKKLSKKLKKFPVSEAEATRLLRMFRMWVNPTLRHMLNCVCVATYCSQADHTSMLELLGIDEVLLHEYSFFFFNLTGLSNIEVCALIEDHESVLYNIGTNQNMAGRSSEMLELGSTKEFGGHKMKRTPIKTASILEQVNYAMAYKYGPPLVKRLFGPGIIYTDSEGEVIVEIENTETSDTEVIVVGRPKNKVAFDSEDMERDSWIKNLLENMLLVAAELQTRLLLSRDPAYVESVMMIFKGMLNFMSSKDIINKETKKGSQVLPLSLERRAIIKQMRDITEMQ